MTPTRQFNTLEQTICNFVTSPSYQPQDLEGIIQAVRSTSPQVRAVDVKIATLDLVSRGCLGLDDVWRVTPPAIA